MALQLFKIASATLTGATSTISFTSIPQGYSELKLVCSLRGDTTNSDIGITGFQTHYLRLNNNLGNLHSGIYLQGNGSTASAGSNGPETIWHAPGSTNSSTTANTFASSELIIPNYSSNNNKSAFMNMVGENNGTASGAFLSVFAFASTAAITQIDILASSGNFVQYSTATLYGIL